MGGTGKLLDACVIQVVFRVVLFLCFLSCALVTA